MKPGLPASKLWKTIAVGGLAVFALGTFIALAKDGGPVTFQSAESRTVNGGPVFNSVSYERKGARDIWMMNQSHAGAAAEPGAWDRLAIVVSEGPAGKSARFYQLEPGALAGQEGAREVPRRATCYMCHANGPRALRPANALGWWDKATVLAWNLKIKTYGRIALDEAAPGPGDVPVRFAGKFENEKLTVPVCVKCHGGSGWFARSPLLRQQAPAIEFMVKSGAMPPLGFRISAEERRALREFLDGF